MTTTKTVGSIKAGYTRTETFHGDQLLSSEERFFDTAGQLHNDAGPAIRRYNNVGLMRQIKFDELDLEPSQYERYWEEPDTLPTLEQEYYRHGLQHRDDGPASIAVENGTEFHTWYRQGAIHRSDGPANYPSHGDILFNRLKWERSPGDFQFYRDGVQISPRDLQHSPIYRDIQARLNIAQDVLRGRERELAARLENVKVTLRDHENMREQTTTALGAALDRSMKAINEFQAASAALNARTQTFLGRFAAGQERDRYDQAVREMEQSGHEQDRASRLSDTAEMRFQAAREMEKELGGQLEETRRQLSALDEIKEAHRQQPEEFTRGLLGQETTETDYTRLAREANKLETFQLADGELARQRAEHFRENGYSVERSRDRDFAATFAKEREPLNREYAQKLSQIDRDPSLGTAERVGSQCEAKEAWHESRAALAMSVAERMGGNIPAADKLVKQERDSMAKAQEVGRDIDARLDGGHTPNQLREQAGFERDQRAAMAQRDLAENPHLTEAYAKDGIYEVPLQSPDMNMAPSWAGGNNQSAVSTREVQYNNAEERIRDAYVDDAAPAAPRQEQVAAESKEAERYQPEESKEVAQSPAPAIQREREHELG